MKGLQSDFDEAQKSHICLELVWAHLVCMCACSDQVVDRRTRDFLAGGRSQVSLPAINNKVWSNVFTLAGHERSPPLQVLTVWQIKKRWRWTDVFWTTRVLHSVCINVKGVGFKRSQKRQSHKTRWNQMWCKGPMGPNRTCFHSECRHSHRFTLRFKILRNKTKARCWLWRDMAALGLEVPTFSGKSQWAFSKSF